MALAGWMKAINKIIKLIAEAARWERQFRLNQQVNRLLLLFLKKKKDSLQKRWNDLQKNRRSRYRNKMENNHPVVGFLFAGLIWLWWFLPCCHFLHRYQHKASHLAPAPGKPLWKQKISSAAKLSHPAY